MGGRYVGKEGEKEMTYAYEAKFPWVLNNGGLCVVPDKDFLSQEMDQIDRDYRQYTLHKFVQFKYMYIHSLRFWTLCSIRAP